MVSVLSTQRRQHFLTPCAGRLEQHATARHSLKYYNNVGATAYYSCPPSQACEDLPLLIYRVLDAVIYEHPALGAIVVDEEKSSPYFVRLPSIKLRGAVEFVASATTLEVSDAARAQELDQILEEQHNQNFLRRHGEVPYWRLVIIHNPDKKSGFIACFIYHHAIADGTSGLAFHRSFLSKLLFMVAVPASSPVRTEDLRTTDGPISLLPDKQILPSLETLHPLPLSTSYMLRSLWHEYFPGTVRGLWTAAPISDAISKRRSRFRSMQLSTNTTSRLLAACRSNSTTLTATVESMLAAALFSRLPSVRCSVLRCDGAVSLRRWLPRETVNNDSIGNWVSRYLEEHRRPTGATSATANAPELFSWDEARRVRATIENELSKNGKDSVVDLLRFAGKLHDYFTKKIGNSRDESFELSNIGVFRDSRNEQDLGSWKIGRVVFSQSADVVGAAFETSLVTGCDGCLNIGFSWLEGIVDGGWMEQVMETLKHLIEDVAEST